MGKTQLVPAGYVVNKNGLGGVGVGPQQNRNSHKACERGKTENYGKKKMHKSAREKRSEYFEYYVLTRRSFYVILEQISVFEKNLCLWFFYLVLDTADDAKW